MNKLFSILFLVGTLSVKANICYQLSGNTSSNVLTVSIVPDADYNPPNNTFTTALFTLSWPEALGAFVIQSIQETSNLPYTFDPVGAANPQLSGGIYYQKFGFSTSSIQALQNGVALSILEITVSHGSISQGVFSIVTTPPIVGGQSSIINFFAEQFSEGSCNLSASAALPLDLIYFNANKKDNGNIELKWGVENEYNMNKYEIEYSFDGRSYSYIGEKKAQNKSPIEYTLIDESSHSKNIYYRLKMIEFDGSYSYSHIINIEINANLEITIFPNPSHGYVQVNHSETEQDLTFKISNEKGEIIYTSISDETGLKNIDTASWPNGNYFFSTWIKGKLYNTSRFVVAN